MDVEIRLFGVLDVSGAGRQLGPTQLGGRKSKQILQILALRAGNSVRKDELAWLLWGERPAVDAGGSLEHYVSLLRRRLRWVGPGVEVIRTEPGGYRLLTDSVRLDTREFANVERACAAADPAAPSRAAGYIDLDLLEDEPLAPWALDARDQYRQRRLLLFCTAAETSLRQGDLATGLRLAVAAAALDPLCEPAYCLLMAAHYLRGDQVRALQVFSDLRTRLSEDLGLPPLPATAALHQSILRHRSLEQFAGGVRSARRPLRSASATAPILRAATDPPAGAGPLDRLALACDRALRHDGDRGLRLVALRGGTSPTRRLLLDALANRLSPAITLRPCPNPRAGVGGGLASAMSAALAAGSAVDTPMAETSDRGDVASPRARSRCSLGDACRHTGGDHLMRALATCSQPFVMTLAEAHTCDRESLWQLAFLATCPGTVSGVVVLGLEREDLEREDLEPGHPLRHLPWACVVELLPDTEDPGGRGRRWQSLRPDDSFCERVAIGNA